MDYPLLLKGEERGRLRVEKQGLYTLMEAAAPGAQGLVRLWVQGGEEEAYLGVMEPGEGGLYLSRKFSRLELASFPSHIERATDRRLDRGQVYITNRLHAENQDGDRTEPPGEDAAAKETAAQMPHREGGAQGKESGSGEAERQREEERERAEAEPGEGEEPRPGGPDPPGLLHRDLEAEDGELLWTARKDGSLVARSGERYLVALPARLRRVPPGARLRRIGGREYLLFVY